jgi:hypothetical protein
MALKERFEARLKAARKYSEGLLSNFKTPEQWTHQVHPQANHALWFAGHMGVTDNFFLSVLDRTKCRELPGYNDKFGVGSQPTSDPRCYPPPEEVLAYMRERREALFCVLASLAEEDLSRPTPQGAPDFLSDFASVFETAIWHEGLHSGQVSVAHRALGNRPLIGG